jgi:hypothetical protein
MRVGASTQLPKIVLQPAPLGLDLVSVPGYSNYSEFLQLSAREIQKVAGSTISPRSKVGNRKSKVVGPLAVEK